VDSTAERLVGSPPDQHTRTQRRTLLIASFGTLLSLTSFTLPLASPVPAADALRASPGAQTWMLSGMALGLAAGLLAAGALGDDYGRRRVFLTGAVALAATSALGAVAGSALVFVLARVGQGLAAAAVLACGLGLIGHAFAAGPARTRATGIWGASVGTGIMLAPLLTGTLDTVGWWAPYALIALLAVLLTAVSLGSLEESRAAVRRPVDLLGVLLLGGGLAALLAGLVTGRSGWLQPVTLFLLVAAGALLGGFVLAQRRRPAPLLDLALFGNSEFVAATSAGLATGAGVISAMAFLPTVVARGLGGDPVHIGSVLVIWSGLSVPVALVARRLRMSGDAQLLLGLLLVAVGQVALTGLLPGDGLGRLLPGLVVAGVGSGILNAALGRQAVASVPAGRAGMGSGVNNTARFVGSGIGVTVISVLVGSVLIDRPGPAGLIAGWNVGVLVSAGFSVLGAAAVLGCLLRRRQ
jgi:MFS family permease